MQIGAQTIILNHPFICAVVNMIYIKCNVQNEIEDITFANTPGYIMSSVFDPQVKAFLENSQNEALIKDVLSRLDLEMVRVIEDMVDLMIEKDLILFTDLPEPVQNKLLFKRSLRDSLNPEVSLIGEEETLNF